MKHKHIKVLPLLPISALLGLGVFTSVKLNKGNEKQLSATGTPNVTFGCVLGEYGWDNNQTINPGNSATILDFSDNFGTAANPTNQATSSYEIGTALTINGVCIKDIPKAEVSYAHGANHFFFMVPVSALTPTTSYPVTTMHINEGTQFMDKFLPEVTLYLINDHWKTSNTCVGIAWNNINYNEVHGVVGTPTDSYTILLQYQNIICDTNVVDMTNAVSSTSDVGNKITVNGVPLNQMEGSVVCMPAANPYLYIYFKDSQIRYTGPYFRVTLEIKEGTCYKDCVLSYSKAVVTLPIGNFSTWVLNPADETPTPVTFEKIEWNAASGNPACSTNPGTLLKFSKALSTNAFDGNGSLMGRNLALTNAGDHIKVNGIPISQISGSELKYYAGEFLFIYAPTMYNIPTGKLASSLTIDKDTRFFDVLLPELGIYYRNDGYNWTLNPPIIHTVPTVEFRNTNGKLNSLSFETHVDLDYYFKLVREYGKNSIELGTFIIDANSYYKSGQVGLANYVNNVAPSSTTYVKIINDKQDFFNLTKYLVDGYFGYKGSLVDIKESNYAREFIGVGYLKVNNQYYFGTENLAPISFFELMDRKYKAGEITTTEYYAPSVQISEGINSFDLNDDSINKSNHSFNYAGCGYYAITSNDRNITVIQCCNDYLRVNIPAGTTKYVSVINGKVVFEDSVAPMYSVVDTTRELWPDSNSNEIYCTADNVSDIAQSFNSKSMRIWAQVTQLINDPWRCGLTNADGTFSLNMDEVNNLKTVLAKFRSKGMHDICLMLNGCIQDTNRPLWYYAGDPNGKYLYSTAEYLAFNEGRDPLIPMACALTFPNENSQDYITFLNNQKEFIRQLSIELDGYVDVYEGFNEIDVGGQTFFPNYYLNDCPKSNALANGYAPSKELIAKWSMDYCKAVTDGVKAANSSIRVLTPAFGCVGTIPTNGRYYKTSETITDIYSYIKNSGTGHPKDYFQGLNIHPYILLNIGIEGDGYQNYFWEGKPSYLSRNPDNKNYDEDWNNMIESIEATLAANNDAKVPMYFSEFGFSDFGYGTSLQTDDGSYKYVNFDTLLPDALTKLNTYIQSKNYIRSIYYFRQLDWAYSSLDGKFPWAICGEPNFGVITETLTLKKLGQTLFGIMNSGSKDYTPVTNVLNRMKGGN